MSDDPGELLFFSLVFIFFLGPVVTGTISGWGRGASCKSVRMVYWLKWTV